MSSGKDDALEKALLELQVLEKESIDSDLDVQRYKVKVSEPIYEKRQKAILQIPEFWYIVLAQHEDFQEYIRTEDMKFLEYIKDIYVQWMVDAKGRNNDPKTFSLTFTFEAENGEIESQKVTKYFYTETDPDTGKESIKSHKAEIKWPKELEKVNPLLIRQKHKDAGTKYSAEDKKNYRIGMKSLFAFFDWTGEKPGKEFRSGEDFVVMFTEDIFPSAVVYYSDAAPGIKEDEEDESSGEELDVESEGEGDDDIEEEEEDEEPPTKKRKEE